LIRRDGFTLGMVMFWITHSRLDTRTARVQIRLKLGLEMQLVIALFSLLHEGSGSVPSIGSRIMWKEERNGEDQ